MEKDPELEERLDNLYLQVESVCITRVERQQETTDREVDFSFLNQYKNLKSVNLNRMDLDNLEPLNLIQNLENLSLKRVAFKDASILCKFPFLKSLSLEEMRDSEGQLRLLEDLALLEKVSVKSLLEDIPSLSLINLPNLKSFEVVNPAPSIFYRAQHYRRIQQMKIINCPSIEKLNLGEVKNLEIESDFDLKELTLNTLPKELSFLENQHRLQILKVKTLHFNILNSSKLTSIISAFTSLHTLSIESGIYSELLCSNTDKLKKLKHLNATNGDISKLLFLEKLKNLKYLNLSNHQIQDIEPLECLENLEYLNLSKNQIKDISPLRKLKNLKEVYLADNQIREYEVLKELPNLRVLNTFHNPMDKRHPHWLVKMNTNENLLFSQIPKSIELKFVDKLWELMRSKDSEYRELAEQLAIGQGWQEEDIRDYLRYTR